MYETPTEEARQDFDAFRDWFCLRSFASAPGLHDEP